MRAWRTSVRSPQATRGAPANHQLAAKQCAPSGIDDRYRRDARLSESMRSETRDLHDRKVTSGDYYPENFRPKAGTRMADARASPEELVDHCSRTVLGEPAMNYRRRRI